MRSTGALLNTARQLPSHAAGTPPAVQDAPNSAHVTLDFVIDGIWESSSASIRWKPQTIR